MLCADHELNVSSFTARCVASAGSTPYEVVQAGLAALQGFKHGGQTRRRLWAQKGVTLRAIGVVCTVSKGIKSVAFHICYLTSFFADLRACTKEPHYAISELHVPEDHIKRVAWNICY